MGFFKHFFFIIKVSLLDIDIEFGKKAIKRLENDHNASGRVLFIKCDVSNKDELEGEYVPIIPNMFPVCTFAIRKR